MTFVRYMTTAKDGAPVALYTWRADGIGRPLCWRCERELADDEDDEKMGYPVGIVARHPSGNRIVICRGCRVPDEPGL